MKPSAAFNRIFSNVIAGVLLLLSFSSTAHAALEATITLKSVSSTTAVITFRNDLQQQTSATGQYTDPMRVEQVRAIRVSDGVPVQVIPEFSVRGKESKDVNFSSLTPGTKYTAEFEVLKTYNQSREKVSIAFTTSGTAPTTGTLLPVEFVKSNTVTETTKINLTVKNTSTKTFKVSVAAKRASDGAIVETREITTLIGGDTGRLEFYQGITAGQTYNFLMTGSQVGATTVYQSVAYDGVKAQGTAASGGAGTFTPPTPIVRDSVTGATNRGDGTCGDGKDNDGDGKYDWDGVTKDGSPQFPPDPACMNKDMSEAADDVAVGSWIPCTNKCDLPNVFVLLNTLITKLITVILFPVSILMFMYAGYKYITAQGNPAKTANIKRLLKHLIVGILLILTAWLIVKTVLVLIGYDSTLYFFGE